ncbi:helix-turn-helix transcriptional regulator [Bacteroidales bacterium OttesenSCG-928-C03]|nr:helix-turn-helix transcriptional regulator [Bacteroidales bacterium OttesenSCG-928-C03]MDL2326148.1 helix-turn-helix transcriptional regulator [Bacteroidales bacterium OttesenSCG-928-A14]
MAVRKFTHLPVNLRAILDAKKMTLSDLANKTGKSPDWFSKVLPSGRITLRELYQIADKLKVELIEILKHETDGEQDQVHTAAAEGGRRAGSEDSQGPPAVG